jgi:hypothetical protein
MLKWLFGKEAAPDQVAPQPAAPISPAKDATEMLADALAQLRREFRSEESRQYKEAQNAQAADERRIAAAVAWIEKAGLKGAIPKLVSTMWHYHAWLSKPGYAGHEALRLVDLSAEKIEGEKVKNGFRVKWRMIEGGTRFHLSFIEEVSYAPFDGSAFANVSIATDDEVVFRVSMIHDVEKDREYSDWRTVTPSVLKPDEWVATILEVEHRIRLAEQRRRDESSAECKRKQAAGLPPA